MALISVGLLFYFSYHLIKGNGDVEGAPLVNARANNFGEGFDNQ